jgi:hypothetical protein
MNKIIPGGLQFFFFFLAFEKKKEKLQCEPNI